MSQADELMPVYATIQKGILPSASASGAVQMLTTTKNTMITIGLIAKAIAPGILYVESPANVHLPHIISGNTNRSSK
jgi:hypothetical protein